MNDVSKHETKRRWYILTFPIVYSNPMTEIKTSKQYLFKHHGIFHTCNGFK